MRSMNAQTAYDIRPAQRADADGIIDLMVAVAAEERWIGTELPIGTAARRLGVETALGRADVLMLVAHAGEALIGELSLFPRRRGLLELGMCVAEQWRSHGIGSALLTRAIAWARAGAAHKIALEVFPHNPAAIALYERFGFVREGYFRAQLRRKNGALWDTIPMGLIVAENQAERAEH
jgi:ribosomal-protein-alanine N-acetyltransferase